MHPCCCLVSTQEVEDAVRLLDREAERLSASSGYASKLLPLPLYAGASGAAHHSRILPDHALECTGLGSRAPSLCCLSCDS